MKDSDVVGVHADAPTLRQLFAVSKAIGRDRFSLLREATAEREAGLVVVMFSSEAIRALGPTLVDVARELGDQEKGQVLKIGLDTSLEWVPKWLDETKQRWASMDLGPGAMLTAFTGTELCARVAKELNARGCPT